MFIVKRTEELNQTYDLHKLPMSQWPKEAREIGLNIVRNPIQRAKMDSQLPTLRRDWLITQIEKDQAFDVNDL